MPTPSPEKQNLQRALVGALNTLGAARAAARTARRHGGEHPPVRGWVCRWAEPASVDADILARAETPALENVVRTGECPEEIAAILRDGMFPCPADMPSAALSALRARGVHAVLA